MKTVLITGAFGQDGYYLVDLLKGNADIRIICTGRSLPANNYRHYDAKNIEVSLLNIENELEIINAIRNYRPDELYHLASFSAPSISWNDPSRVAQINGVATIQLLENIRKYSPKTRLFFASSAKIFGTPNESPQTEDTPANPSDPYSMGKYIGHQAVKAYRKKYGIYACNGILYNHESALKNTDFVVYKICKQAIELKHKRRTDIELYNINSNIDLGDPRDYVKAMKLVLSQPNADDYIISSGKSYSLSEICQKVGGILNIELIESRVRSEIPLSQNKPPVKLFGNNSKIISRGWKPTQNLDSILGSVINNIEHTG